MSNDNHNEAAPVLGCDRLVSRASSVAEIQSEYDTILAMHINADPRNKWECDFYKNQLAAVTERLREAKRTANIPGEP